jgi:hypothetical protein
MSIRKSLEALSLRLTEMSRVVKELEVHVADESSAGAVLVDKFEYEVQDLLGTLTEGRVASGRLVRPSDTPPTPEQVCAGLTACHEVTLELNERLASLLSYETIHELLDFGERRGGGWRPWSQSVHTALEACRKPMADVHRAILDCWQDAAERFGAGTVSVQATNIGQQLRVPKEHAAAFIPVGEGGENT